MKKPTPSPLLSAFCSGWRHGVFTWRRKGDACTHLIAATLFDAFYWVSHSMAFLFPGVAWTDPNLLEPGQSLHRQQPDCIESPRLTRRVIA